MRLGPVLVVAMALLPAPAAAQGHVRLASAGIAPDASGLAEVRAAYVAALNARDAAQLARLYAPDAIAMLADGIVRRGRAGVSEYFQTACEAQRDGDVVLTPGRFTADGSIASETGSFVEMAPDGRRRTTGAYVTIYTRDADGRWRIAMDVRTRGRDAMLVRW